MGSQFNALASRTPLAWMVGHKLWYRAWHQVPAGSLPDDDDQLCHLAEMGFDVKSFRKVREVALRGWVRCSDGRLYHRTVAEAVLEAWIEKLFARLSSQAGNAKRYGHQFDPRPLNAGIDGTAALLRALNPRSRGLDKIKRRQSRQDTTGVPDDLPPGDHGAPTGSPGGTAGDLPVASQEKGKGNTLPERALSAQPPPEPEDPNKEAWRRGPALLVRAGSKPAAARSLIGKVLREFTLEPRDLLPVIVRCEQLNTPDPASYLRRGAEALRDRRPAGSKPAPVTWPDDTWRHALRNWRDDGSWGKTMGAPPGQPGCIAPAAIIAEIEREICGSVGRDG